MLVLDWFSSNSQPRERPQYSLYLRLSSGQVSATARTKDYFVANYYHSRQTKTSSYLRNKKWVTELPMGSDEKLKLYAPKARTLAMYR
jgi:hypothetical protein